jgi:hypothetical protein
MPVPEPDEDYPDINGMTGMICRESEMDCDFPRRDFGR